MKTLPVFCLRFKNMSEKFDLTVIGSGPGGYVAAIRAAQLGMKTAIIEKRETLGGTCLNVGCIPSKALLDSSEKYESLNHQFEEHGIKASDVKLDLKQMMKRKDEVVADVCGGVDFLMKKNKITRFHGFGSFLSAKEIEIKNDEGKTQSIESDKTIIATGSVPVELPGIKVDGKQIITSDHAIALKKVPEKMAVIGAGVIGLELGSVWRRLGSEVHMIELLPSLFPGADSGMSKQALSIFKKQGLKFYFEHMVKSASVKNKKVQVEVENKKKGETFNLEVDSLLVAVGRRPYTDNLGLEQAGVELTDKKRVKVDSHFKTTVDNIYAIGDVIDGPMLAHKAEEEGVALAEILAGQAGHVSYLAIPSVVYTWPEIAWLGKSEDELKEEGVEYKTGKSFFRGNGRARAVNEIDGQVKILADKKTDRILGASIIGPNASELIAELAVSYEFAGSAEDVARAVHAHPTLAEVIKDAAQNAGGWAIHQ